ncbi:MAG: hypothetical protein HQM10_08755 [Candidatus Riflebacteria bacterium]|nr:hypothetical protein [Candidatus Riflebacteria bacterium]
MKKPFGDGLYAGVDIGSYSIKAVTVERKSAQDTIVKAEEVLLSPQSEFPGDSEYYAYLSGKLDELARKVNISSCKRITAIFHDREILIKFFEFPSLPQLDQLEQMLFWEAKKLLPPNIKNEQFVFSWRPVKTDNKSFALAVIPLSRFKLFLSIFENAGIKPDSLIPEAFSVLAAKDMLPKASVSAFSFINIGHQGTHINIFSENEPKFYRQVPSGVSELAEVSDASEMEVFAQKIRFSFDYFRARTKLGNIDEIYIYGGGANNKLLFDYAKSYFLPGKVEKLNLSVKTVFPDESKKDSFLPATIGILGALENLGSDNLLESYRKMADKERFDTITRVVPSVLAAIFTTVLIVSVFFWKYSISVKLSQVKENIRLAENSINAVSEKYQSLLAENDRFRGIPESARKILEIYDRERLSGAKILLLAAKSKPSGISLKRVQILPSECKSPEPFFTKEPEPDLSAETGLSEKKKEQEGNDSLELPPVIDSETVILEGTSESESLLLNYIEKILHVKLVKKIIEYRSVKKSGKIEFQFRGKLP